MRFVGRGHPAVRATHTKTLELTPADELTGRGTCIVAVGAEAQPAAPMAGPVRIRIAAGGLHATVTAHANSSWDPSGPIVVRRRPLRLPGTFATDADLAAADLPRDLVAALQDPDALVTVDVVAARAATSTVVLFAADPSRPDDPRLRAELAAADSVEAQDAGARAFVEDRALVEDRPGYGLRHLVVTTADLPRRPGHLAPGTVVEVVGLPTQLAVIAAAGGSPYTVAAGGGDLRRALRRAAAGTRTATVTTPTELVQALASADQVHGSSRAFVAQPSGPVQRADVDTLPQLFGRDPVYLCFESFDDGDLDPDIRAAITGLLAEGVTTRTAAAALARLTGMPKRAAYDTALALARADATQRGRTASGTA